ncbi:MAG TPA: histidine phosphatase family protein [Arenibaculum sp.]|nr:histidine phosphatase family protein [Arenibaculum sp.]
MSGPVSTIRWWLVRHAPTPEAAGRIVGRLDIGCDLGDAGALDALARALPAGALWLTTPLRRAGATARALAERSGERPRPQPREEPGLAEQDFGAWQGSTWDELAAGDTDGAVRRFWRDAAASRPPGGESFADLAARVAEALVRRSPEAVTQAEGPHDVVAVCHGGPIRAALALALGIAPERALAFEIEPLSLTRIDRIEPEHGPACWRVAGVNLPPCPLVRT